MLLRTAARWAASSSGGRLRFVASRSDDDGVKNTTPSKRSEDLVSYAVAGNLAIAGAKGAVALTAGSALCSQKPYIAAPTRAVGFLLIGLHGRPWRRRRRTLVGGKSVYLWSLVSALGTFWLGGRGPPHR